MKNTFFVTTAITGVKTISVKAADLMASPVAMTDSSMVNFEMVNGNLKHTAVDMVVNALEIGAKYVITHKDARLAIAVCDVLDSMLEEEVNTIVDDLFHKRARVDVMAEINAMTLSDACRTAIVGLYEIQVEMVDNGDQRAADGIAARMASEVNPSEVRPTKTLEEIVTMFNIEEVVIKGVNITERKVVDMMAAAGLTLGGRCVTKVGEATILGFEAGPNGVLVVVVVDGDDAPRKLQADRVEAIVIPASTGRSEEDQLITNEIEKLMGAVGGIEAASRSAVSEAIFAGGMTIRSVEDEITEAERFEAAESERMAGRQKWIDDRKANAAAVSGSEAAQRILALANQQLKGGEAPQENKDKDNGQSTRRPASKGPQQNKNNNGGNVQMKTQTQGTQVDRPVQGVAGGSTGKSVRRPQANTAAPQQRTNVSPSNNGKTTRRPEAGKQTPAANGGGRTRLNIGATGGANNNRGTGTRLGAGTPVAGATQRAGVVSLRMDTPMSRGGFGGKWYEDASRFPTVMSGADFEANRANLELGITGAKFYDAHAFAESRGYEARENDMAIIVLEFGPALSFNFQIKLSSSPEARQPWYCSNVSFVKTKNGNGGYWTYVIGRRKDDAVMIEKKGEWVMASAQEVEKAAKDSLWTVKGQGWVNDTIYGMRMGEEIIAQVMRFADYAWSALYTTEVGAE